MHETDEGMRADNSYSIISMRVCAIVGAKLFVIVMLVTIMTIVRLLHALMALV